MSRSVSVVVPVFNEEDCLEEFYRRLRGVADTHSAYSFSFIFVDDGSSDRSLEILKELARRDRRIQTLSFSRNFGHQIAVKAGIDHSNSDAVVSIDADLQDPPEAIADLIAKWREGYDVVYGTHVERQGETFFKKFTASAYYRILKSASSIDLPLESGDFRLISRDVANVLRSIPEKNPYLRGLVAWAGFRQASVPVKREARFAGSSKYPLAKMLKLAWNGLAHFSFAPLRLAFWFGAVFLTMGSVWGIQWTVLLFRREIPPPWLGGLAFFSLTAGIQFVLTGILGAYLAMNYDQNRPRPLYILKKTGE